MSETPDSASKATSLSDDDGFDDDFELDSASDITTHDSHLVIQTSRQSSRSNIPAQAKQSPLSDQFSNDFDSSDSSSSSSSTSGSDGTVEHLDVSPLEHPVVESPARTAEAIELLHFSSPRGPRSPKREEPLEFEVIPISRPLLGQGRPKSSTRTRKTKKKTARRTRIKQEAEFVTQPGPLAERCIPTYDSITDPHCKIVTSHVFQRNIRSRVYLNPARDAVYQMRVSEPRFTNTLSQLKAGVSTQRLRYDPMSRDRAVHTLEKTTGKSLPMSRFAQRKVSPPKRTHKDPVTFFQPTAYQNTFKTVEYPPQRVDLAYGGPNRIKGREQVLKHITREVEKSSSALSSPRARKPVEVTTDDPASVKEAWDTLTHMWGRAGATQAHVAKVEAAVRKAGSTEVLGVIRGEIDAMSVSLAALEDVRVAVRDREAVRGEPGFRAATMAFSKRHSRWKRLTPFPCQLLIGGADYMESVARESKKAIERANAAAAPDDDDAMEGEDAAGVNPTMERLMAWATVDAMSQ